MKVSYAFIVKNEEDHLENALKSIEGADEIVIVDTGSTDRTLEIARKYTDKIFEFPWIDDFAAARNFAISKCTGDWVQSIDADHWMLSSVDEVRQQAEEAEKGGHAAAWVHSVADGKKFSHYSTTLFRREGAFWTGKVHEYLTPRPTFYSTVKKATGYSINHKRDPERNLRILESYENKGPRQLFYLGREYYERRRYREAIHSLRNYIQVGTWDAEIAEAWLTIARCHWFMAQGNEAREACAKAVITNPMFKEALLFMATLHHEPWKHKWITLAEAATNEGVLFNRV
jgi:glycosyltransferase involved in cell wall biosynthesis